MQRDSAMKCLPFLLVSGILVVVLLTLVSPQACAASSSITTSLGMSMAESNMDLEFMMGSEFGSLLASHSGVSYHGLKRPAVFNCGRGQRYCLPGKNPPRVKACPRYNPYNRNCQ